MVVCCQIWCYHSDRVENNVTIWPKEGMIIHRFSLNALFQWEESWSLSWFYHNGTHTTFNLRDSSKHQLELRSVYIPPEEQGCTKMIIILGSSCSLPAPMNTSHHINHCAISLKFEVAVVNAEKQTNHRCSLPPPTPTPVLFQDSALEFLAGTNFVFALSTLGKMNYFTRESWSTFRKTTEILEEHANAALWSPESHQDWNKNIFSLTKTN